MGSVLNFPTRPVPSPTEARVAANAAMARAFMESPRGRFLDACQKLFQLGYEHTADQAAGHYEAGFKRLDRVPCPKRLGAAFAEIASIPSADPLAARQARIALVALAAIAFPVPEPTSPEVA